MPREAAPSQSTFEPAGRPPWLAGLLAALAVLALAWLCLGDFSQAFRQDRRLDGPAGGGLLLPPGQTVLLPVAAPPGAGRRLQVRLDCRGGQGCADLALGLDGAPARPMERRPGRVEFQAEAAGGRSHRLKVKNQGSSPVELNSVRLQNYAGVNNNFPRLALLLSEPQGDILASWPWLGLLLLAWTAQALAAWLLPASPRGLPRVRRLGVWLAPPAAALAAWALLKALGLNLLLAWDGFLLFTCLGPVLLGVLALWRARDQRRWLAASLPWAALLAAFVLVSGLVLLEEIHERGGGRPDNLIQVSQYFAKDPRWVPSGAHLQETGYGYDGQFFLYMAQDPWASKGARANLDSPAYRYQRMLYPLFLNLLSGGDKERLPQLMLVVNVLCVLGAFVVVVLLARRLGAAWPWALFFFCGYGLIQPAYLGLSEPLANLLLALSLYGLAAGWLWWAAFTLSLMVLTRESYMVLPMVGTLRAALLRRWEFLAYLPAVACGLAWQMWVIWRFGHPAYEQSNPGNLTWLLLGILGLFASPAHEREILVGLAVLAMAALCVVLLCKDWRRRDLWLLAAFLVVPLLAGESIWGHYLSYPRVAATAFLAYLPVLFRERSLWAALPAVLLGCHTLLRLLRV